MKAVIISVVGLLLAIGAQAQDNCGAPAYTENIVPKCLSNTGIWMPNYANVSTYYFCGSNSKTPVVTACPAKTPYFTYVWQACTTCSEYIPAVECSRLTVGLDCQPMQGGESPSPGSTAAPGTTVEPPTKAPPATKTSTVAPTTTTPMPGPPTDTTTTPGPVGPGGTTVFVPMPPSPNEGPTPPGPDPTVPNLPSGPPVSNN